MRLLLAFCFACSFCVSISAQQKTQAPEIGIVQGFERDSLLYAGGYRYIVESIATSFSPRKISDAGFQEKLRQIRSLKTSLYALNIFVPGELKVVGPAVDETAILTYADTVCRRSREAGVGLIIWGSGGSRRVPDGFDRAQALKQFVSIAGKVAEVARKYKIVIALENLNSTETNFINTVEEVYQIVKAVDHPNFRLCADIYHMLMEREPPLVIEKTSKYLVHCDLAERENRSPPGTHGDDFREYFRALKKAGYHGKIVLECRWPDLPRQAVGAREVVQKQIEVVWGKQ